MALCRDLLAPALPRAGGRARPHLHVEAEARLPLQKDGSLAMQAGKVSCVLAAAQKQAPGGRPDARHGCTGGELGSECTKSAHIIIGPRLGAAAKTQIINRS